MKQWKNSNVKIFFGMLALSLLIVILLLPVPPPIKTTVKEISLTPQGKTTLAVLAMAVLLWMTEAVAFPVTGLLAIVVLVVTKAQPFRELVKNGFGSPIFLFFLGVLIITAAISETGILHRIALWLLHKLGHKPKYVILFFLTMGTLMAFWITDMAVAAMLFPLAVSILKDAGVEPLKSNFGRTLMISCAWGPLMGGIATPVGCGTNPLTISFLKDLAGVDITFANWMVMGAPASIMMLPCAWLILLKIFPMENINVKVSREDFKKKMNTIGPVTRKEFLTVLIFGLTIFLWVSKDFIKVWTGGAIDYLDISFVAIMCPCLFFLPGIEILDWKRMQQSINWGGIILIVTGLSIGMAIYNSGAAEWLAWVLFNKIGMLHPIGIVFVIVLGVSLMKVLFSSNTVTGVIIVPLLIALAKNLGLDPVLVAVPAGITSSLAFILVTSTPTNVIPYSAGYFSIVDMAKAGLWMTVASSITVTASICIFGRLFHVVNW